MTCHDARERFTDLLDDVLDAPARADLAAHLAGCGECRAELERLRETVSLLHGLEPPRAPAGFVERVVAGTSPRALDPASRARSATRPRPLERAPRRRFFLRLPVDVPAGVAAFLLLAVGVGFLVTRVPELEDARRVASAPGSAPREEAYSPPTASERTAASSAPGRADGERDTVVSERDVRARALADRAPSVPADTIAAAQAPAPPSAPAPPPAIATAPETPPQTALKGSRDEARALSKSSAARASETPARTARVERGLPSAITAQLRVADRDTAPATVINLVNRARGVVVGSSADGDDRILELMIPRAELPRLLEGLRSVGALSADVPADLPPDVHLVLRIGA